MKFYMFRTVCLSVNRSLFTVQEQVPLENSLRTCMTYGIAECTVNKFLMVDRRTVRNMYSFMSK